MVNDVIAMGMGLCVCNIYIYNIFQFILHKGKKMLGNAASEPQSGYRTSWWSQ